MRGQARTGAGSPSAGFHARRGACAEAFQPLAEAGTRQAMSRLAILGPIAAALLSAAALAGCGGGGGGDSASVTPYSGRAGELPQVLRRLGHRHDERFDARLRQGRAILRL